MSSSAPAQHATPCSPDLFLAQCDPGRRLIVGSPTWDERWETRICQATPTLLQIFAPKGPTGPIRRFPGALVAVQIPTAGALFTLQCTLQDECESSAPLWNLGEFATITRIQRRRAPRYKGHFRAEILGLESDEPYPLDFHLPTSHERNISTTGCYLLGNRQLPLDTLLQLRLAIAHRPEPIEIEGVVVRHEQHPEGLFGHGIDFGELLPAEQASIQRLITHGQRHSPDSLLIG